MLPKSAVDALALAVAVVASLPVHSAVAGSWTPVEIRRAASTPDTPTKITLTDACVWTRWRGWHHTGWLGSWHACRPGPDWRYERRCWIGPANVHHCRFYG